MLWSPGWDQLRRLLLCICNEFRLSISIDIGEILHFFLWLGSPPSALPSQVPMRIVFVSLGRIKSSKRLMCKTSMARLRINAMPWQSSFFTTFRRRLDWLAKAKFETFDSKSQNLARLRINASDFALRASPWQVAVAVFLSSNKVCQWVRWFYKLFWWNYI